MLIKDNELLSERALQWVMDQVHSEAKVLSVQRLHGGMSSIVHNITIQVKQTVHSVVLRQFDNAEWLKQEPDIPLHEAESLRWAAKIDLPTPLLIAFDETGDACGIPAVLMTKLDGTVILKPPSMEQWLNGLATALTCIHAVNADEHPWNYFTYNDISSLKLPEWSNYKEQWQIVLDLVKGTRPAYDPCYIHRDYHPTNVLWSDNKISGVVDWVNACKGPAGIDVGHCRLNLALLYGVEEADAFLAAYRRETAIFKYEPYWDLLALIDILFGPPTVYPGWEAFGVTNLTNELMVERLDRYMISLVNRSVRP